jgi:hypothetical protein
VAARPHPSRCCCHHCWRHWLRLQCPPSHRRRRHHLHGCRCCRPCPRCMSPSPPWGVPLLAAAGGPRTPPPVGAAPLPPRLSLAAGRAWRRRPAQRVAPSHQCPAAPCRRPGHAAASPHGRSGRRVGALRRPAPRPARPSPPAAAAGWRAGRGPAPRPALAAARAARRRPARRPARRRRPPRLRTRPDGAAAPPPPPAARAPCGGPPLPHAPPAPARMQRWRSTARSDGAQAPPAALPPPPLPRRSPAEGRLLRWPRGAAWRGGPGAGGGGRHKCCGRRRSHLPPAGARDFKPQLSHWQGDGLRAWQASCDAMSPTSCAPCCSPHAPRGRQPAASPASPRAAAAASFAPPEWPGQRAAPWRAAAELLAATGLAAALQCRAGLFLRFLSSQRFRYGNLSNQRGPSRRSEQPADGTKVWGCPGEALSVGLHTSHSNREALDVCATREALSRGPHVTCPCPGGLRPCIAKLGRKSARIPFPPSCVVLELAATMAAALSSKVTRGRDVHQAWRIGSGCELMCTVAMHTVAGGPSKRQLWKAATASHADRVVPPPATPLALPLRVCRPAWPRL